MKTILLFKSSKNVNITSLLLQAGWLNTAILESLGFPVLILKYLNLKNY